MSLEIGLDLIDAITVWSDRVDEDLTQDDIDAILRIQLAIDNSEYRDLDISDYSAADLAELKTQLHDVDAPTFTAWVIDEALAEFDSAPPSDPEYGQPPGGGAFAAAAEEELTIEDRSSVGAFGWASSGTDLLVGRTSSSVDDNSGLFAERGDTATSTPAPIDLAAGPDSLGPAFLPPAQRSHKTHVVVAILAAAALIAFVLAGIQIVGNIERGDDEVASSDEPDAAVTATAADQTDHSDDLVDTTAGSGELVVQAAPTPAPELPAPESRAIVLTATGDVWTIDLFEGTSGEPTLIFDEDAAATDISRVKDQLAVVDDDGIAHILSLDEPHKRVQAWADASLPDAQQIVATGDQYAVLDVTGSINLFDRRSTAMEQDLTVVWDASAGGTPPARSIDAYKDLVPFTVGNGEVRMVITSFDDNRVNLVWDPTNQPRAFNLEINEHGLFMGVGGGAVARYQWFGDGPDFQAIWDPLDGSRLPAIGYAALDDQTAVVLNSGTVALVGDGEQSVLWDAEVSDLRAVSVASSANEVLLTLADGSVLRAASDGSTEALGTVWDAQSDSTSPAAKVLIVDS